MFRQPSRWIALIFCTALLLPATGAVAQEGDPDILAKMYEVNEQLATMGLGIAVESLEVYTTGIGRPSNRIHQQSFGWVANDGRRLAQGDDITYLVDQSAGGTASGLSNFQTETAIDTAMTTWQADKCLRKVNLVKRADDGSDVTIFDSFFGFGGFGNPFAADIVNAGWLPPAFFDAVIGPGGSNFVLAFSVSFIFVNPDGSPADANGDQYIDTALNEVYYNDNFNWGINVPLGSGIDTETVGLHENGHSLSLGHFGPPPDAVMNPVYAGIRHTPLAIDHAGMCTVWSNWPN